MVEDACSSVSIEVDGDIGVGLISRASPIADILKGWLRQRLFFGTGLETGGSSQAVYTVRVDVYAVYT